MRDEELAQAAGFIPLTKGKFAIVDKEDLQWLLQWKWTAKHSTHKKYYAVRGVGGRKNAKHIKMHRLIMGDPAKMEIDHINGNSLDNRRCNLRIVTRVQNCYNIQPSGIGSSKFKGVCWDRARNEWKSYIHFHNKYIHLGRFKLEWQAAFAYNIHAIILFGEFAYLNVL